MKRRTFLTRVASALGLSTVVASTALGATRNSYKQMTLADIPKDGKSYYGLSIAVVFTLDKSLDHPAMYIENKICTRYAIDSEVYLMRRVGGGWRFDSLRSHRKPIEGYPTRSPQLLLESAINTEELAVYKFDTLPEFFDFASMRLKKNPTVSDQK